jgi:hypothetical protein
MKPINSLITGTLFATALAMSAATATADMHDNDENEDQDESNMDMEATFITGTEGGDFLSDDLMGNDVHTTVEDDESIGTIEELLLNEEGEIKAVIVSVGGFLGMGEKNVAIAWESLELSQEDDEYVVKVNASQDALENAENFEED